MTAQDNQPAQNSIRRGLGRLLTTAITFVQEYYGSTAALPSPIVFQTSKTPFHYRSIAGDAIIGLNPFLPLEDFLASVGEEATHYVHGRENPELSMAVAFAQTIWKDEFFDDEKRKLALVTFGKLRNVEEFVGRLGALAFLQNEGKNPEVYANGMDWAPKGHPAYFDDIQHQTGYQLALEVMRKGTPPLNIRRELIHCATLKDAIDLTAPHRIEDYMWASCKKFIQF